MTSMFLPLVSQALPEFPESIAAQIKATGQGVSPIWHLFSFKPKWTRHLADFTHEVMRGPSPLSSAMRELIAALTSRFNQCLF